jgi:biopolymer transport protein ExbD
LATFVLFTLSLDKLAAIDVQLPQAVDNPSQKPDETMLSIQVSEPGTIYMKIGTATPQLVAPNDVPPLLEDYKTRYNPPKVLISGDTRAKFGAAVMVLDEVRKAGIEQVSVATTTTQTGK